MNKLKDILYKVGLEAVNGDTHISVNQIQFDSRKIGRGDLFVAIRGSQSDGHDFIQMAVERGATAVICEEFPQRMSPGVTYIQVADSHSALGIRASNFHGHPSRNLKLIGITGTNGKTTVATLLYQLFTMAGYKVGLISTIKVMVDDHEFPTQHTTPDVLTLNGHLRSMNAVGVEYCFMEVSSHGIEQKRIEALHFTGAVFTNLTHDHLDYHKTFAAYRDTKKKLFDQLPKTAFALVNSDDRNAAVMVQNTKAKKYSFALKSFADYRAQLLERQFSGQLIKLDGRELWSQLIGDFNAYNLLAIYGVADLLGLEKMETLKLMSRLETVSGRFQYFISQDNITAIVDYAHTPDALKNILETIQSLRTGNERVITVVGCGGDRDRSKRPVMGQIASAMSDKAIFTSDNPRGEVPGAIIAEMEKGVEAQNTNKVLIIEDRKQAIKTACSLALVNDIILIAGKGHETYQEIQGVRVEFDDFKEVQTALGS